MGFQQSVFKKPVDMNDLGDNSNEEINLKKRRKEALEELLKRIGKENRPLNIAIIGTPGSGKSSFINTLIASITGEWRSHAMVGCFGGLGLQKTKHIATYRKEKYLKHAKDVKHLMKFNFPAILDMSGIDDANDRDTKMLLDLVFSGRIPENSKISDILQNIRQNEEELNNLYPLAKSNIRVDRIIFLVSAANPSLPENLMQAVHSSSTSRRRDIPMFGVLTKIDDPFTSEKNEYQEFISRMRTHLGILDIHLLRCTNYCDVNLEEIKDGIRNNLPEIDISVLRGMKQILDPSITVTEYKRATLNQVDAGGILMLAFVILMIAIFIMLFGK
ncbi:uncharacterized protein LOC125683580 [Ostrea edulis]|uniref:uncharacterized protein LOC125683580 n=1 Tax=Ostrea edulis TaxID=37623 RepID=UPI0024AEBB58|nr:uncharacterized protein LOC125683580 [Ostrea edulis]XP_048780839.2 uncharacterized protein LOC125683580 [Ostrea edulis]